MELKENFDKLSDGAQQYIDLKVDNIKLHIVENMSLFCSDLLSRAVVGLFAIMALFFAMIAVVLFFAMYVGLLYAFLIVAGILLLVGALFYFFRKSIFANVMVGRFCRMFFPKNDVEDE